MSGVINLTTFIPEMKIADHQLLVIIDPQKDFTNPQGAYAKRHTSINQILQVKNELNKLLNIIPANKIQVVCSNYQPNQFGEGITMCIPGTTGHEVDIELQNTHHLIYKTEHSCFSTGKFSDYLKDNKITELILSGFLAEYCVRQTAIDGLSLGYKVTVLSDLIATGDDVQDRIDTTLSELKEQGAETI